MTGLSWLEPVLKTWLHIIFGASVISVRVVCLMMFGRWVRSIMDQIEGRHEQD